MTTRQRDQVTTETRVDEDKGSPSRGGVNRLGGFDTSRDASTSLSLRSARAGLLDHRIAFEKKIRS